MNTRGSLRKLPVFLSYVAWQKLPQVGAARSRCYVSESIRRKSRVLTSVQEDDLYLNEIQRKFGFVSPGYNYYRHVDRRPKLREGKLEQYCSGNEEIIHTFYNKPRQCLQDDAFLNLRNAFTDNPADVSTLKTAHYGAANLSNRLAPVVAKQLYRRLLREARTDAESRVYVESVIRAFFHERRGEVKEALIVKYLEEGARALCFLEASRGNFAEFEHKLLTCISQTLKMRPMLDPRKESQAEITFSNSVTSLIGKASQCIGVPLYHRHFDLVKERPPGLLYRVYRRGKDLFHKQFLRQRGVLKLLPLTRKELRQFRRRYEIGAQKKSVFRPHVKLS